MSFSGPLKYPCEAAGCPEISNTFGRGFKTSCRNVLPCSSFCDVERDGGEVALPEKVTLDEFWSLTTLSLCSVELLLLFRNLFSELPFTEFLMRWGLFLPTWVGLIFCEANWVTVLSWHFDRALAYFSTSLHLSATPMVWPQNPSLLHFGQLLSQEIEPLFLTETKWGGSFSLEYDFTRYWLFPKPGIMWLLLINSKLFKMDDQMFSQLWLGKASCNKNSVAFKLNSLWSLSSTISFTRLKQCHLAAEKLFDHRLPLILVGNASLHCFL